MTNIWCVRVWSYRGSIPCIRYNVRVTSQLVFTSRELVTKKWWVRVWWDRWRIDPHELAPTTCLHSRYQNNRPQSLAVTRCHELSLPLIRVCTGQSSDSERARDQWQCAAVTPQVNLSFSFVSCISKHVFECIAIESS